MPDLNLQGVSVRMLIHLGDAALRGGDPKLALGIYRRVASVAPRWAAIEARIGLARRAEPTTPKMLELLNALDPVFGDRTFVGEGLATWLKSPPFAEDDRFLKLVDETANLAPLGAVNWHWNLQTALCAAQAALGVDGDFVELGVYKGHTSKFLIDYLDFARFDRRFWLYDTFEGVPQDQLDPGREALSAKNYGEPFSFEEVRQRFAPYPNVAVIKGRVPEVLEETAPERIAYMHIDLNNAAAEVAALEALFPRLSPGGVLLLDDYCWTASAAQYKAESAWFRERGVTAFPLPTGQGLLIKPPG